MSIQEAGHRVYYLNNGSFVSFAKRLLGKGEKQNDVMEYKSTINNNRKWTADPIANRKDLLNGIQL